MEKGENMIIWGNVLTIITFIAGGLIGFFGTRYIKKKINEWWGKRAERKQKKGLMSNISTNTQINPSGKPKQPQALFKTRDDTTKQGQIQ